MSAQVTARRLSWLLLGAVAATPAVADSAPCSEVVADTVAEMRAGADSWWSDDIEKLVRAAAGSACVKSRSSRYTLSEVPMSVGEQNAAAPATGPDAAASSEPVADGELAEDGSWTFGGLTFRSKSGSPGKKPYQRNRTDD